MGFRKVENTVSIFGLGYVGSICLGCLVKMGYNVIGVDINRKKLKLLKEGKSPVMEKGLDTLIAKGIKSGRIFLTTSPYKAVSNSSISLVCVGTPSKSDGDINYRSLKNVCGDIGKAMLNKRAFHIIVIRSTVLPTTTRKIVIPLLERKSKKIAGVDFGVVVNPEFLRESSGVEDFFNPSKIIVGEFDKKSAEKLISLYQNISAPLFKVSVETAEMIKYIDNVWHALKISFTNEVGVMCRKLNIDANQLMKIFCADTKLNISPSYLMPGNAFGGSCLPKDVKAFNRLGDKLEVEIPLINSILHSNTVHLNRIFSIICRYRPHKIGFLGVTFKPDTDDVRESPIVKLIALLKNKGYEVFAYDENLISHPLMGENKRYLDKLLPRFEKFLYRDPFKLSKDVDFLVVSHKKYKEVVKRCGDDKIILELVPLGMKDRKKRQFGICW